MVETASSGRRTRLNLQIKRSTLAPACVVLVVAVLWFAIGAAGGVRESRAVEPPAPIEVNVHRVGLQSMPYGPSYIGRTEASQIVEIRSRIRGFLNERRFHEGGAVNVSQVLYMIDQRPFEVEVMVAKARLSAAEAHMEQAKRQLERYRGLQERQAATPTEIEERETELITATAEVELLRAELIKAELDLSYTIITSPIDGMIGRSRKDVGSFVDDGSNSLLATLEQTDPMYVQFSMSERELLRWRAMREAGIITGPNRENVEVDVFLSSGVLHPHRGRLSFVDVSVDQTTSTVLFRATLPNPDRTLRSGQSVRVSMLGFQRPAAIIIPKAAVLQTPTSASVYVVDPVTGIIDSRPVTLGEWFENGWLIESGLAEGDLVVIDNLLRLRPGTQVAFAEEEREAIILPELIGTKTEPN